MSAAPSPGDGASLVGRTLGGHYRVEALLGAGGMGVVYRARHVLLGRDFALKVLPPALSADPGARSRLLREGEALARISNPHVVPVRHVGEEDGLLYLVMDLAEGGTLRDVLAREGPLEERRAARIAIQVLLALDAAHWEGVVHRDLKPENVLVSPPAPGREGPERVRVVDFGLARVDGPPGLPARDASSPGAVAGTVAYMSPEQIRGDGTVDARTDLFAAGVLLHEMLGGRAPFEAPSTLSVAMAILDRPAPPLPAEGPRGVTGPVRAVIDRALEKDREARFRTAGEMADALRAALAGTPPPPAPRAAARRPLPASSLAVAGVLLAALSLPFLLRGEEGAGPAADRAAARSVLLDSRFEDAAAAVGRIEAAGLAGGEDHLLRGRAWAGLGDRRALAAFDRAAASLGADARPGTERARFLLDEGSDPAGAEREIDAVLAVHPDPDARYLRLRILHARAAALPAGGERDGVAARMAADAAALEGDPRREAAEALVSMARGDPDEALDRARRAAEARPDLADAASIHGLVCQVLAARERLPEGLDAARRWNERALEAAGEAISRARRRPDLLLQGRDLVRLWRTACTVKYALGDEEGAAADYRNEVLPRNPGCLRDLGVGAQYQQWAGRFEEALRLYAAARAAGAGGIHLHGEGFCRMQLGRRMAERGDVAGALRELDASVAAFTAGLSARPGEAAFRTYRAEAWLARARIQRDDAAAGSLAKAAGDFAALEAAGPVSDPEVLFRRWELRHATGDAEGALADIRAAVAAGLHGTAAYRRRLAFSCIENAREAGEAAGALLDEARRAADEAERWNPRRAELSCILRAESRAAQALRAGDPEEATRLRTLARGDFAKAIALAALDPRVRSEARLRLAGLALEEGDAEAAVREAGEALRLRKEAEGADRSILFVNDDYLRSPLAAFHGRLAEALAAAGRTEEAAREAARAKALR